MTDDALDRAVHHARAHLAGLGERPVAPPVDVVALRAALGRPLPRDGVAAATVLDDLAADADPGLVASPGPRYFGFVTGGSLPAALGAEWLTAAWDQNGGMHVGSPAASVVEDVVEGWVLDLLGLPGEAAVGFVTGAQM